MPEADRQAEFPWQVARGRYLLLYVFAVAAAVIAADIHIYRLLGNSAGPAYLGRMLVRNAIMVMLLIAVWAGLGAARYIMGILFLFGALFSLLLLGKDHAYLPALGATMAILMGSAASILLLSGSLDAFMRRRRSV